MKILVGVSVLAVLVFSVCITELRSAYLQQSRNMHYMQNTINDLVFEVYE